RLEVALAVQQALLGDGGSEARFPGAGEGVLVRAGVATQEVEERVAVLLEEVLLEHGPLVDVEGLLDAHAHLPLAPARGAGEVPITVLVRAVGGLVLAVARALDAGAGDEVAHRAPPFARRSRRRSRPRRYQLVRRSVRSCRPTAAATTAPRQAKNAATSRAACRAGVTRTPPSPSRWRLRLRREAAGDAPRAPGRG